MEVGFVLPKAVKEGRVGFRHSRYDLLRASYALLAVAAVVSPLSGCSKGASSAFAQSRSEQPGPLAIVILEDGTASCAKGREVFNSDLMTLVSGGYLGKGASVAIVRSCKEPELLYAGSAMRGKEIKAALALATVPCTSRGSNPKAALEMSKAWLTKPEFQSGRRMILAYSDLIPDGDGAEHRNSFANPAGFDWSGLKGTTVHVFGLLYGQHNTFQKAWSALQPAPIFHQPGEQLNAVELGLRASVL